jgi:environmental stress-induced protein Ves
MRWSVVSLASVVPQPWRNGGGITRELLAWPDRVHWSLRLSVADIHADGPFSRFEGIERSFAVLEGDGLALSFPDEVRELTTRSEPFTFDGGRCVGCTLLGGATRDFNLMAAPATARLRRVRGCFPLLTREPTLVAIYAHAHRAQAALGDESIEVPARHLAWALLDRPLRGTIEGDDALWVEARR